MRTTPGVEVTDGQRKELERQLNEAIDQSGLDKAGAQRVLGRGGEFLSTNIVLLRRLGSLTNPFGGEEVGQTWFSPKGWKPSSLGDQAENLAKSLQGFEPQWREDTSGLVIPDSADGICLLPTLTSLGKLWSITDPYRSIGEVIEKVCVAIAGQRAITNYRHGELTEQYVRLPEGFVDRLQPLEEEAEHQGYNCLTLPFHFGDWKTGKCYSPRNATWQALNLPPRRLPLCVAQNGCLLLGMPDRLTNYEQLFIDCCDQYSWCADGRWSRSPCFSFDGARLKFGTHDAHWARGRYGLPVAFLGV